MGKLSGVSPNFLAALLLALFVLQGIGLIRATSPTTDEVPFHMVNGYAYLISHDYRMSPANPALIREWMALPWLWIKPKINFDQASWRQAESVPFGVDTFYRDNRGRAGLLLFSSRFMILILGALLGALVFRWSSLLYGAWGGLLSLFFYVSCPNFLSHSAIATTDVGVALFAVLASFYFWKYLESASFRHGLLLAAALGLAFAAKHNALFLGPLFLCVLFCRKGGKLFFISALLFSTVGFLIIWASYFFEWKPILAGGVPRVEEKLGYLPPAFAFLKKAALQMPVPIPSYILGLAGVLRSHRAPYSHFAFGEWTTRTQWYYYFFVFLVKMALPFLAALFLRAVFWSKKLTPSRNELWAILAPGVALFALTVFDTTAVGIRYLFLVIPLLYVWVGGLAGLCQESKVWKGLVGLLMALQLLTTLPYFPYYLSYFNPLAGGPNGGYRYVRGSDVDWGQGLVALKKYLDERGIGEVALEYFGSADPSFYGIRYRRLSPEEKKQPGRGVYAVSRFRLEKIEWTRRYKPTDVVAYSIHIYDFRGADEHRVD